MAKGSGGTKKSTSSNPKGIASGGGFKWGELTSEGKSLGIEPFGIASFENANGYANKKNAPEKFIKEFDANASQIIMDIINKADKKASAIRDKKVEDAFDKKFPPGVESANYEYNEKMKKVRAFADKLRKVQQQFFS